MCGCGELEWSLGKSFECSVGHGHDRRTELTDGANGRWRQTGATRGRARGKGREGFYRLSNTPRRYRPSFVSYSGDGMVRRWLATCGGRTASGGRRRTIGRVRGGCVAPV
jgi:hypothetical protein